MKKDFFTGLALLLPFVITAGVIIFVIKLITNPLMGSVFPMLNKHEVFNKNPLMLTLSSRLIILGGFVAVTTVVGVLGRGFLFNKVVRFGENLIQRTPFLKTIYKSFQDVVKTVFNKSEDNFSEVVLVPFPHAKARCIGLITRNTFKEDTDKDFRELISVFVPGTPNPTMGFLLFFRKEQLTPVNMSVKQALKFIISGGAVE